MKRQTFFSFHFKNDSWRASEVRNMGVVEGNKPVSDNDWEKVKKEGDEAIEKWINKQLKGKECTIVLIGSETYNRKWVEYEIERSWNLGKGIVGIKIHNLKDKDRKQSKEGRNPFEKFKIGEVEMSSIVKTYNPPYKDSKKVYYYIKNNIADWVEEAIEIRNSRK